MQLKNTMHGLRGYRSAAHTAARTYIAFDDDAYLSPADREKVRATALARCAMRQWTHDADCPGRLSRSFLQLKQERELAELSEAERKKYLSKQRKAAAKKAAEETAGGNKKEGVFVTMSTLAPGCVSTSQAEMRLTFSHPLQTRQRRPRPTSMTDFQRARPWPRPSSPWRWRTAFSSPSW